MDQLLLIGGAFCFGWAAVASLVPSLAPRINLVALGLFFWILAGII